MNSKNVNEKKESVYEPIDLMLNILNELGCQPTREKNDSIFVAYQGELFEMQFLGKYIRIWDPGWFRTNQNNQDLMKILKAANHVNKDFGPTLVFTDPDEKGDIVCHSLIDIMFDPDCRDNVSYIKDILNTFFRSKSLFFRYLSQN